MWTHLVGTTPTWFPPAIKAISCRASEVTVLQSLRDDVHVLVFFTSHWITNGGKPRPSSADSFCCETSLTVTESDCALSLGFALLLLHQPKLPIRRSQWKQAECLWTEHKLRFCSRPKQLWLSLGKVVL